MLRRWLFANIVYRAAVFLRGEHRVYQSLHRLRELQTRPFEDVHRQQLRRLAAIVSHAWEGSQLYRERWPTPPPSNSLEVLEYLKDLPLLDKGDLRRYPQQLRSSIPLASPLRRKTTGGSTGEAVTVMKNADAIAKEMAASWLAYEWMGIRMGDKAARFWGNPASVKRRARFIAADLAMNRIRFSAFDFDDAKLQQYWRRCLSFRPAYFYGYVSMLSGFAQYLRRAGEDGRRLGLKAIVATSEVLGNPDRLLLEAVFGCPVQNEYGCGEVGPIAYNRGSDTPLSVMADNVFVEVLRPDGSWALPGEEGEIVVSDLNNRAMPLIRYRVGDRAEVGNPKESGLPFPESSTGVG